MQLLFESSEETPGVAGLGILKGKIVRIPEGPGLKIPHMGWNSLNVREGASLFKGLEKEPYVYFVHSYYLQAKDPKIVAATAEYGVTTVSYTHLIRGVKLIVAKIEPSRTAQENS